MCGGRWEDGDLQATSTKVKPGESQGSRLQGQGGVMQPGAFTEPSPDALRKTSLGNGPVQYLWFLRNHTNNSLQ